MLYRFALAFCILLLLPLLAYADGMAYGKGFTQQLWETHQLAVINLTESTADVSMFIAIEGIPAGKELTYILPFWYRPDGFTLTEDTAEAFRTACVDPAHKQVERVQRIAARRGSNDLLSNGALLCAGIPALLFVRNYGAREKGRGGGEMAAMLTPYAQNDTPHAHAALYRIGGQDLQQLIAQSGLPAKLLAPLAKYHTPFFAVMRLKGLSAVEQQDVRMSGKGVRYHFTHQLPEGRYVYPLGTGAAWPQPIPITEVYLACPERLGMEVKAPVEGERTRWPSFYSYAQSLTIDLADMAAAPTEPAPSDATEVLATRTGSIISNPVKHPSAWQIAYLQSNPREDISVRLVKQPAPWRFAVAEFFALPGIPLILTLACYLLAWFLTFRLHIRRQWQRAGSPGDLVGHGVQTFLIAQLLTPFLALGIVAVACGVSGSVEYLRHPRLFSDSSWLLLPLTVVITGSMAAAFFRYAREKGDWRKWLAFTAISYATLLFAAMSGLLYGIAYWCETM